jgi:hypothetical protein
MAGRDIARFANDGPVVAALDGGPEGGEVLASASALARGLGASWDCLTIDTGDRASAEEGESLGSAAPR